MTLAELIRNALSNPQFRLALEAGDLSLAGPQLSAQEIAAAVEALRYNNGFAPGEDSIRNLFRALPCWGKD